MSELQQATPRVKKNLLLIRVLLTFILFCFASLSLQVHPEQKPVIIIFICVMLATFIPFYFLEDQKFEKVRFQFIVFSMDFVFLMGCLFLFDHFETNLLIIIFMTFFISALSQSVGRSILVAIAVISLYIYLIYLKNDTVNYLDPVLLLSCALLFVVSVHSGYLAYRTVQEEIEIMDLAKKTNLLSERVKEGDVIALEYAGTLKNVLDTLPIGAIAVSVEGNIIFVNARVGKLLDLNPRSLTNLYLFSKDTALDEIGSRMAQSIKERRELKREYLDITWKGIPKRFRLDSASGSGPNGKVWGTLFLLQETVKPTTDASGNIAPSDV